MIKPLSPEEAKAAQEESLPDEVIETVNYFLTKRASNLVIRITVAEVREMLNRKGFTTEQIYGDNLLDIENVYRKAGWKVTYDKPGYNESYEPYWDFSKR